MIDFYYWPTPNGHKVTLFLEEAGVAYTIRRIDIGKGEQFAPAYLAISPNGKMPAIVDHDPPGGGTAISIFESGAILFYLARKHGMFIPSDIRGTMTCMEWLFWQMAGLGPMTGQYGHFTTYAPEPIPYAIERYTREARRLLGVLDQRLRGREYICGNDYTIADMACYPWINPYTKVPLDMAEFVQVRRWQETIRARPATARAYAQGDFDRPQGSLSDSERSILFGGKTSA